MRHFVLLLTVLVLFSPALGETANKNTQSPSVLPERLGNMLSGKIQTEHGEITEMEMVIVLGTPLDLKDLLDNGADPNTVFTIDEETGATISALLLAVKSSTDRRQGYTKIKMLLDRGADPNLSNPDTGITALHEAARADLPFVAEILLDAGADPLKPNIHGESAYQVALDRANVDTVQAIELRTDFRHPDRERLLTEGMIRKEQKMRLQGGKQQ